MRKINYSEESLDYTESKASAVDLKTFIFKNGNSMKKSKSKHQNLEECNDTSDKKRIISIKKKEKKMLKMDNAKEDI